MTTRSCRCGRRPASDRLGRYAAAQAGGSPAGRAGRGATGARHGKDAHRAGLGD